VSYTNPAQRYAGMAEQLWETQVFLSKFNGEEMRPETVARFAELREGQQGDRRSRIENALMSPIADLAEAQRIIDELAARPLQIRSPRDLKLRPPETPIWPGEERSGSLALPWWPGAIAGVLIGLGGVVIGVAATVVWFHGG
jgi:hypothetical protein